MELEFANRKLRKRLEEQRQLQKFFGQLAKPLRLRLALLRQVDCLADVPRVPPPRCHQLREDRHGQFAVDLKDQWRLIFEPANEPVPTLEDGTLDLKNITRVRVLEVVDYHKG